MKTPAILRHTPTQRRFKWLEPAMARLRRASRRRLRRPASEGSRAGAELIMGVAGARSRAAASVGRAQDAAALSAAPEAGAGLHDGHEKDAVATSAKREKEGKR